MSLVVIGTGTEIGKTITCAVILTRYADTFPLTYWKPVATGGEDQRDLTTILGLCGMETRTLPETYLFQAPRSPHEAAQLEGARVDPVQILDQFRRHCAAETALLIEGIGGLLVPLTSQGYLLADLLTELELPCLLVASSRVGTINHTLLTLEALRSRGIPQAGVVLNGPPDPENCRAIRKFGKVSCLMELGPIDPLSGSALREAARGFDPGSLLSSYFRASREVPPVPGQPERTHD